MYAYFQISFHGLTASLAYSLWTFELQAEALMSIARIDRDALFDQGMLFFMYDSASTCLRMVTYSLSDKRRFVPDYVVKRSVRVMKHFISNQFQDAETT